MPGLCQHPEFIGSPVEPHQISVAGAFQGSIPQWPYHKSVGQPFVLVRTCSSKLFAMPHEMPLKIMAVFKRHGVGNVTKLYISLEVACRALVCDGIERDKPNLVSQGSDPNCYFAGYSPSRREGRVDLLPAAAAEYPRGKPMFYGVIGEDIAEYRCVRGGGPYCNSAAVRPVKRAKGSSLAWRGQIRQIPAGSRFDKYRSRLETLRKSPCGKREALAD
jgi:hypothetical protein